MKFTAAVVTGLLATSASALFDKYQPWGKRDYSCINAYSGPTENSTIAAGTTVEIKFDRNSGRCDSYLDAYPAANYSLWLYNNPVSVMNGVKSDAEIKIRQNDIPSNATSVTFTVPTDLPEVDDETVWYLRLSTSLNTAPQMPSLFSVLGPFRIVQ
ncbi:hypothetical protein BDW74DRAFT_29536 [Aspergillus multicolor]|uniref:uncharacterized protein n=1 Tax=Aspergillus multicolor TaxID=41759 RepID=UPI003CCC98D7